MWRRIVLVGFSGSGKTTTARLLGDRLGWRVIDLDEDLERHFGTTIPEVFASQGEAVFRIAEREWLEAACGETHVVIATGGGAAAESSAWTSELLNHPETLTVTLDVSPEVSLSRLLEQHASEGDAVRRPMIEGDDPLSRIAELKGQRQQAYDRSRITIPVDYATPETVADEILSIATDHGRDTSPSVTLNAPGGVSRIFVESGLLDHAGQLVRSGYPNARKAWIVSDTNVAALHAKRLQQSFAGADLVTELIVVAPGESSKSVAGISDLFDAMLHGGVERGDLVVALGGGVIGDLAGFAAATVLRGIGLAQIPTSLLAMVDSSVGGKTGINHPAGKNLIGSFYQPPLVLIDPELLQTLPQRELNQGWAEVIKHAVIQPSTPGGASRDLQTFLERNTRALLGLEEPVISYAIRRNIALKARVVEADERESGIRAYLNFGHTLGHAIEASDYSLLHGEAIALGIRAAARLSSTENGVSEQQIERLDALLDAFALPRTTTLDPDRVLNLLQSDKKRVAGAQRWVLMSPAGGVEMRSDISDAAVRDALRSVSA